MTTQQIIAGIAAAVTAVAAALQVVQDPSETLKVVTLVFTVLGAGLNAFLVAVSTPMRMAVQIATKHTATAYAAWRGMP